MTSYAEDQFERFELGLSQHYPLLRSALISMRAKQTLEFGAGGSTNVFLSALPEDGRHVSLSLERQSDLLLADTLTEGGPEWLHHEGRSETHRDIETGALDIVLHDGSHAADEVAGDVAWVWPRLRQFGLLLVHDVHSDRWGADVSSGLLRGLRGADADWTGVALPFGYGLAVVRREDAGAGRGDTPRRQARGNMWTEPCRMLGPDWREA